MARPTPRRATRKPTPAEAVIADIAQTSPQLPTEPPAAQDDGLTAQQRWNKRPQVKVTGLAPELVELLKAAYLRQTKSLDIRPSYNAWLRSQLEGIVRQEEAAGGPLERYAGPLR